MTIIIGSGDEADVNIHYERGWAYLKTEDCDRAIADFDDVKREHLSDDDEVTVQFMDIHGNQWIQNIGNITLPEPIMVDINADGVVNIQDLVRVASQFGEMWDGKEDVNSDGIVNILDLVLVANAF